MEFGAGHQKPQRATRADEKLREYSSVPRKNAIHEFKIFPTKNAKVAYQPTTPGLGWGTHTNSTS